MKVGTQVSKDLYQFDEEYKGSIATVDAKGDRVWIYPKKPTGRFHRRRIVVTVILLSLYIVTPFIQWDGHPFMLFNFFDRKFIVFGSIFWPQDFLLLAIALIIFFVFITLFTVAFGRIWCGWLCPQTIFMEMVFRKIEYWIEGDAPAQRRLAKAPWTGEKIRKRLLKHSVFVLMSLFISHIAMAYLIGVEELKAIVVNSPLARLDGFVAMLLFTLIFYAVFAWFREQACVVVCPYGRFQGVLLSKFSLVVAYDFVRGEPRGKIGKQQQITEDKKGDCIDCKLCVHVCPTGIDIRNGTQLECVNCTACIDACDEVMTKIDRPKGLIRLSSDAAIREGKQRFFTPRLFGYSCILVLLLSVLVYFIATRADVETTILKAPGSLYTMTDDGYVMNLYQIEFVNKTFKTIPVEIKIEKPANAIYKKVGKEEKEITGGGMMGGLYIVKLPAKAVLSMNTPIVFGIYSGNILLKKIKTNFIGPIQNNVN